MTSKYVCPSVLNASKSIAIVLVHKDCSKLSTPESHNIAEFHMFPVASNLQFINSFLFLGTCEPCDAFSEHLSRPGNQRCLGFRLIHLVLPFCVD